MVWILKNLQAAAVVFLMGLAFGSAGGGYIVKILWDLETQATMEESLSAMKYFATTIQDLEIQGAKDEETIRNYRRRTPSTGVRLPPVACGGSTVSGGGVQGPTGDQPLPNPAQRAFDNYADGTGDDALEADLAMNDCRTMQAYMRNLKPRGGM